MVWFSSFNFGLFIGNYLLYLTTIDYVGFSCRSLSFAEYPFYLQNKIRVIFLTYLNIDL